MLCILQKKTDTQDTSQDQTLQGDKEQDYGDKLSSQNSSVWERHDGKYKKTGLIESYYLYGCPHGITMIVWTDLLNFLTK